MHVPILSDLVNVTLTAGTAVVNTVTTVAGTVLTTAGNVIHVFIK